MCMILLSSTFDRCMVWGEKTHIFAPSRFSSRTKAKGKTHVCFPNRSPKWPGTPLQAVPDIPILTLAMPAIVALFAPLLVHHRVTTTLGAQVPGDAHMT